jgi:DNA-binding CsgD family transcriptional regulator
MSWALRGLGEAAHRAGDLWEAAVRYEESLALNRRLGVRASVGELLLDLGHLAVDGGDQRTAVGRLAESLALQCEVGRAHGVAECLVALGRLAAAGGQAARAGRLFGAAEVQLEALGRVRAPADRARYQGRVTKAREALAAGGTAEAGFAAAWAAGRMMTLEEALACAHEVAGHEDQAHATSGADAASRIAPWRLRRAPWPARGPAPPRPCGLTAREAEVLRLLSAHRSNREIAEELVLSVRTVERHLSNIFAKIDAHNRREARAFAGHHGLAASP